MKQKSISLKDQEHEDLLKIMKARNIDNLHRTIKIAIEHFIEEFKESHVNEQ